MPPREERNRKADLEGAMLCGTIMVCKVSTAQPKKNQSSLPLSSSAFSRSFSLSGTCRMDLAVDELRVPGVGDCFVAR